MDEDVLVVKVVGDWTQFDEEARRKQGQYEGTTFHVEGRTIAGGGGGGFPQRALPAPGDDAFSSYARIAVLGGGTNRMLPPPGGGYVNGYNPNTGEFMGSIVPMGGPAGPPNMPVPYNGAMGGGGGPMMPYGGGGGGPLAGPGGGPAGRGPGQFTNPRLNMGGGGIQWGGLSRAYYYSIVFALWEAGRASQISERMQLESALAGSDLERLQAISSGTEQLFGGVFSQPIGMLLDTFGAGPSSLRETTRLQEVRMQGQEMTNEAFRAINRGRDMRTAIMGGSVDVASTTIDQKAAEESRKLVARKGNLQTGLSAYRDPTMMERLTYQLKNPFEYAPRVRAINDEGTRVSMQNEITAINATLAETEEERQFKQTELIRDVIQGSIGYRGREAIADVQVRRGAPIEVARARLAADQAAEFARVEREEPYRLPQLGSIQAKERAALEVEYHVQESVADISTQSQINVLDLRGQRREFEAKIETARGRYAAEFAGAQGNFPEQMRLTKEFGAQIKFLTQTEQFNQDQASLAATGQTLAIQQSLDRNPLGSALTRLSTQRQLTINAIPEGPSKQAREQETNDLYDAMEAMAKQQYSDQTLDIKSKLGYQKLSINALMDRNPLGAKALGMAGQGEQVIRDLQRSGRPEEAAEARQNLMLALRYEKEHVLDQYRAQEVNAPQTAFGVQANGQQDLAKGLKTIEDLLRIISQKEFGGLGD